MNFYSVYNVKWLTISARHGTTASVRRRYFFKCLPTRIITDLQRRIAPKDELEEQLRQRYSDKKSTVGAAVQFFRYKQEPGQTIEEYAQQVNFLATQCQYNDFPLDRLIRDVFISGLQSSAILSAVLQTTDTQSFEETVQRAKTAQQLKSDAISIQHGRSAAVLCIEGSDALESLGDDTLNSLRSNPVSPSYVCIRCGAEGKHFHKKCFALNLFCNKCGKKGHIAKMCKGSASATFSNSSRSSRYCQAKQNLSCDFRDCSRSDAALPHFTYTQRLLLPATHRLFTEMWHTSTVRSSTSAIIP